MASLSEMLQTFNAKAAEFNLKTRKAFRDRKDAYAALSKIGIDIEPPETAPLDTNKSEAPEEVATEEVATAPQEQMRMSKPRKRKPAKKAAKKSNTKKPAAAGGRRRVDDDDTVQGMFKVLDGSKQEKVLTALLRGDPLSMKRLATIAGSSVGATSAIVAGLDLKTKGKLLNGGPRPPYKVLRSKEEGEVIVALIKEK
jgi:hypothetical protein